MISEAGLGSQVGLLFRAKLIGPDDKSRLTSGRCVRRVQIGDAGQHDDELVTTDTCDDVVAADMVLDALGDLREQCVAAGVPVVVVDGLEVVDVDIHEPDALPVRGR